MKSVIFTLPAMLMVNVALGNVQDPAEPLRGDIPAEFIQKLFDLIAADQVQQEIPLKLPDQWHKHKGVYSSVVKLYFHGETELAEARRLMDLFDNNMFVTAWVTSSLMEAYMFAGAPRPTEEQISLALNSFTLHIDKNSAEKTSAMTFWPQSFNSTTETWYSAPVNLQGAFELADLLPLNLTIDFLKAIELGDLSKYVASIIKSESMYLQAFHIPPDFDDTFVNLGLGALLYQVKAEFPNAWKLWDSHNPNVQSVFEDLKKYAYRPFSKDPNVNSIDPRSYLYMRGFLDQAAATGQDIALVTTWIQNIEDLRTWFYKGVAMPFQSNNVDVTVCANTVFGITSGVLSGLVPASVLQDPQTAQIYLNISSLIAYELNNNISSRPDLALLYYPSQIEFDWFVSRTVSILEIAKKRGPLPVPVMEQVYQILSAATRGSMTKYILSQAKPAELNTFCFDDFMGDGDLTFDGRPFVRGEDRIFTTAMAVNALVYTWTELDETTKNSTWRKDVSEEVKKIVDGAARWLFYQTLNENYDPWNAFFSGSMKGFSTFPEFYPGNRFEYLNGTKKSEAQVSLFEGDLYLVQGHIPKEEYERLLKEHRRYGLPTPQIFHGYNAVDGFFPMWSSVPYTYSTVLIALSRYDTIVA